MREQSASVGSVSAPTDKELPVWGSQAERQMWAGHSACTCKVHSLDQRDLLQCTKTRNHGLGSGRGVEGSGRRLHSFRSYVRLTRQTLAAVPRCCCMMSQAGLQAMQADSSLLNWEQSSVGILLCWEAQGPSYPTLHLVRLPHYCPTSHLQENQDSIIRPISGQTGYETTFWMTFGEGKTIICVGENLIWKGKGKTLSVWKGK